MSKRWEYASNKFKGTYVPKKDFKPSHAPRKEYTYPPPHQPNCTINSNSVYIVCQKMWKENDIDKFNRFLSTMKYIRKAIMQVGSDDAPEIATDILEELESHNKDPLLITEEENTQQVLPTESKLFDSGIWYYIFRAMLPRSQYTKSEDTFSIISLIFKNILETYLTATYERYKSEADVIFQKTIRANHLKRNVKTDESKYFRVKSYAKSFYEYKDLKQKTIGSYYEKILQISSVYDMTETGNVLVDNIWKMFSMYFQYTYPNDVKDCTILHRGMLEDFFKNAHPDFTLVNCNKNIYLDWAKHYADMHKLYAYIASPDDIMKRDIAFIKDMEKIIRYGNYTSFQDNPNVYKAIGLVPLRTDDEILSALNKLSERNFETLKYTFNTYSNSDIVRVLFEHCQPEVFVNTYMKLFKFLEIDDSIIDIYIDLLNIKKPSEDGVEQMYSEPTIAGLYVHGYIESIDAIVMKFDKVNIPEVIMSIYRNKHLISETDYIDASKQLLFYARKYSKEITGKYKWCLMDIIDELSPKQSKAQTQEKPAQKKQQEDENIYQLLSDEK